MISLRNAGMIFELLVYTAAVPLLGLTASAAASGGPSGDGGEASLSAGAPGDTIILPRVPRSGDVSIEEAIWRRRSIRSFTDNVPALESVSRLLWAAQGITDTRNEFRSAPSAGATYPLELYLVTAGHLSRYVPEHHCLVVEIAGDLRAAVAGAALEQSCIEEAPLLFVFAAVVKRTEAHYGDRAERYVQIEAGCAAENLMLEAAALGLGSVAIGAYYDDDVNEVLGLQKGCEAYLIVPVGVPAD
jgi:SagB-type dehydrogenase family enzyme